MFHPSPAVDARPPIALSNVARAAAAGDEHAWDDLVARLNGVLHSVARRYRLVPADVEDVVQTTWLRAVDHVDRIDDPGAIAAWLIVTVRREAMRALQRGVREVLVEDTGAVEEADQASPDAAAIQRERELAVHGAVRRLAGRQRALLTTMLASPAPSYEQLAARLDMPVGSIGPTRERALARLREDTELVRMVGA